MSKYSLVANELKLMKCEFAFCNDGFMTNESEPVEVELVLTDMNLILLKKVKKGLFRSNTEVSYFPIHKIKAKHGESPITVTTHEASSYYTLEMYLDNVPKSICFEGEEAAEILANNINRLLLQSETKWACVCGAENRDKFCQECGIPKS